MRKLAFQRHPSRERELRIRLQSEKRGPISIFPLGGKRWGRLMECHAVPDRAQGLPGFRPTWGWEKIAELLADEDLPGVSESIRAGKDESSAIVEVSARLCYMSFGRGRRHIEDFITNLLSKGDGRRLRARQLRVRDHGRVTEPDPRAGPHRAGFAYSQRSQRFVDESDSPFVLPPAIGERGSQKLGAVLSDALEKAAESYQKWWMLWRRPRGGTNWSLFHLLQRRRWLRTT